MLGMTSGGVSPIPLSDLSFWYEFDNAAKITQSGGYIQKIVDSSPYAWEMTPRVNDPVYSSGVGYSQFTFGAGQSLQNMGMKKAGAGSVVTSGFMMLVMEFNAFTNNRSIGAISRVDINPLSPTYGYSINVYGRFICATSGGNKLNYNGRMTASGSIITINGTTILTTGQKYLIAISVPLTGGTYYEIDGVPQNNDVLGSSFCGVQELTPPNAQSYWRPELGQVTAASSYVDNQSHKVYEFLSYQAYDATKYAEVETYLKTKYGIV